MFHKVVTNLRVDEVDWLQIKAEAAELGMSINEYINSIIKKASVRAELALEKQSPKKPYSIWNLPELAKIKDEPMELSEQDKIIYGQ
ncbi:hypothetical protein HYT17_02850 [Candidatus Microgenomates bacterium]|nr:hypothetical protein [Candidatus Microgenomates bacterium]